MLQGFMHDDQGPFRLLPRRILLLPLTSKAKDASPVPARKPSPDRRRPSTPASFVGVSLGNVDMLNEKLFKKETFIHGLHSEGYI
ncbi:hypothetical protein KSP40_PGU010075 [Platanthera guangdongensis]|uniref:Uncharacterized protein n=1 Tax=Platanthera guangdongensis TaxID=2320717 RepID=A0ABR2MAI9_9ASPA